MKFIATAFAFALSFGAFANTFSSQVTKKYCDDNMHKAVTNSEEITRTLVPPLVYGQVPTAVTNFMKGAGIPTHVTNTVTIEYFNTNYITTVTNQYTIDNRFSDRIVGTNSNTTIEIDAVERLYKQEKLQITIFTQIVTTAKFSLDNSTFLTNLINYTEDMTQYYPRRDRYTFDQFLGSDNFYYLCQDRTVPEVASMRIRVRIFPDMCISGSNIYECRLGLQVVDGWIYATPSGTTNYVTETTFPALGEYLWFGYSATLVNKNITTWDSIGTSAQYNGWYFNSMQNSNKTFADLRKPDGSLFPVSTVYWNKQTNRYVIPVTNKITSVEQLATYKEALGIMSKIDASIIVTNPVFIAELDRQLARYDNMGKTNVVLSAMYATNAINSASAAAQSAAESLASKNSAASSEANALSYKNSASGSASSASYSASTASQSASSAVTAANQANTTIRNILNDTTEVLISQTRLDGSLYHVDGVPTDGSGVVNQYAWMNLSDLTAHYPSKFQYTIHAKASGGLYNYTKAIPFTGFKALGHSALPYYDMGTYKSGNKTVELTLFMSNHYWVVRESITDGTNSGSRDWKSSGSYYGPDNWTTLPSFTAGSWVGYSSWGNIAMSELSVTGVAVDNKNYYAAVSAFDGGTDKKYVQGEINTATSLLYQATMNTVENDIKLATNYLYGTTVINTLNTRDSIIGKDIENKYKFLSNPAGTGTWNYQFVEYPNNRLIGTVYVNTSNPTITTEGIYTVYSYPFSTRGASELMWVDVEYVKKYVDNNKTKVPYIIIRAKCGNFDATRNWINFSMYDTVFGDSSFLSYSNSSRVNLDNTHYLCFQCVQKYTRTNTDLQTGEVRRWVSGELVDTWTKNSYVDSSIGSAITKITNSVKSISMSVNPYTPITEQSAAKSIIHQKTGWNVPINYYRGNSLISTYTISQYDVITINPGTVGIIPPSSLNTFKIYCSSGQKVRVYPSGEDGIAFVSTYGNTGNSVVSAIYNNNSSVSRTLVANAFYVFITYTQYGAMKTNMSTEYPASGSTYQYTYNGVTYKYIAGAKSDAPFSDYYVSSDLNLRSASNNSVIDRLATTNDVMNLIRQFMQNMGQ